MTVLIAPDKFKGSLTANQVCEAINDGLGIRFPGVDSIVIPMADGGEGTCELLTNFYKGTRVDVDVTGPLFEIIKSSYGVSQDRSTAFIEMASASGLQLVDPRRKNPLYTTSYGTGQLILHALELGVSRIILGIGGSSTTDAGIGMAEALGFEFYDTKGKKIKSIGENLVYLDSIRHDRAHTRINEVEFVALCDVDNPLFGPKGAAYTYSPQKGADSVAVKWLDDGLKNFERVVLKVFSKSADFPGAGAGGGLAGGAKVFLDMQIHRGMDFILNATNLAREIQRADLIITGEGKVDNQTLSGKVVMEVAKLANRFNRPVVVICGSCELPSGDLQKLGISQVVTLVSESVPTQAAQRNAYQLVKQKVSQIVTF